MSLLLLVVLVWVVGVPVLVLAASALNVMLRQRRSNAVAGRSREAGANVVVLRTPRAEAEPPRLGALSTRG